MKQKVLGSIVVIGLFALVGGGWYAWESDLFGGKAVLQPVHAATHEPAQRAVPDSLQMLDIQLPHDPLQNRNIMQETRDFKAQHEAYLATLSTAKGEVIGRFSTSLAGHNATGRVQNIILAASKLQGKILMPGEQLSFNQTLGNSNDPRDGWQLATVIVGKKFEQGYGGGICQVSSTLYNSVLNAGLQVDERYTHSLPVGYVTPGHDATVSYPELDFKFSNALDQPVRIGVEIVNGNVICKMYALPAEKIL